jgi:hypothetical protein
MACANTQHGNHLVFSDPPGFAPGVPIVDSGADVAACSQQEAGVMSQAGVAIVVEKLLADENLRIRLALDPWETIAELLLHGFDLSGNEIDLFCRTDPRVWFLSEMVSGEPERLGVSRRAFA